MLSEDYILSSYIFFFLLVLFQKHLNLIEPVVKRALTTLQNIKRVEHGLLEKKALPYLIDNCPIQHDIEPLWQGPVGQVGTITHRIHLGWGGRVDKTTQVCSHQNLAARERLPRLLSEDLCCSQPGEGWMDGLAIPIDKDHDTVHLYLAPGTVPCFG